MIQALAAAALLADVAPAETLRVPTLAALPPLTALATLGAPAVTLGDGQARVWLARSGKWAVVYTAIVDPGRSPSDELVVSLDMAGDAAAAPQHDDFQWRLRRVLDSSVVYRGRGGRWEPPRDDPEWRLGAAREGGGWQVESLETASGWRVALRLHAAMLAGESGRDAALAFRVYDGNANGWSAWPPQRPGAHPTEVERAPSSWSPVRFDERP